jgi:hypothetical protein
VTKKTAIQFLDYLLERLPFKVQVIQTDIQAGFRLEDPRLSGRRREDSRVRRLPVVVADRSERAWHDFLPVGHEAGGSNAEDVNCPISNSATDSSDPC